MLLFLILAPNLNSTDQYFARFTDFVHYLKKNIPFYFGEACRSPPALHNPENIENSKNIQKVKMFLFNIQIQQYFVYRIPFM